MPIRCKCRATGFFLHDDDPSWSAFEFVVFSGWPYPNSTVYGGLGIGRGVALVNEQRDQLAAVPLLLKGGNKAPMSTLPSSLSIPDSLLAKEATDILREHSTDLLFNHSIRVYLFAAELGRQQKRRFDPELLCIAAAFHDFGLIKKFSSLNERFEVDGANAARQFLTAHNIPEEKVQTIWEAIALHTTPGVTQYMRPEVALLYSGVGLDVLGKGFDQFPSKLRDEIAARYPRKRFREDFLEAYFGGFAHKPGTTYGTVNAGICERLIPGYTSPNACDLMAAAPFPDSE
jgi:hypothetical protein